MKAVISDVHSNIEAFRAVLEDIEAQGIKDILCLGDMVGYGPNPREAIALTIKTCRQTILGNHEMAVMGDQEDFNERAKAAVRWTKNQLVIKGKESGVNKRLWDFLGRMKKIMVEGPFVFVHASPRDYTREYIFPRDIYEEAKLTEIFAKFERYCLVGHTHIPGVITEDMNFLQPQDFGDVYRLTEKKAIINTGSVGQPRDGDNRACYVILRDDTVEYRRVPYDFERTMEKIKATGVLPEFLAKRLAEGR
jgi:diadenosine tetraphosphatase ApaH/serine/threonine PP2A family protein phosphatase